MEPRLSRASKTRYVLINGVLVWGLFTGTLWTLTMYGFEGFTFARLLFALSIFLPAGAVFGLFTWRFSGREAQAIPTFADTAIATNQSEFRVRSTLYFVMGVVLLLIIVPSGIYVFPDNPALGLTTIPLSALAIHSVAVLGGAVRATTEFVELKSLAGTFRVRWDEMTRVDTDATGTPLLFCADERHLPLPTPQAWSGPDKSTLPEFINTQIRDRHIPTRVNPWSAWRLPKGVRVPG